MAQPRKAAKRSGTAIGARPPQSASHRPSRAAAGETAATRLAAENEALRQRIRQLEEERDTYRKAIYAWAREQLQPEDFRRVAAEKDGLPLSAFLDRLQAEADAS